MRVLHFKKAQSWFPLKLFSLVVTYKQPGFCSAVDPQNFVHVNFVIKCYHELPCLLNTFVEMCWPNGYSALGYRFGSLDWSTILGHCIMFSMEKPLFYCPLYRWLWPSHHTPQAWNVNRLDAMPHFCQKLIINFWCKQMLLN